MNHQRFKFYHHSTNYYRQLYDSIKQLEESCKEVNYEGATAVEFTEVGEAFGSFLEKEIKDGKFSTKKQR